jgi:hypothetical protein
VPLAKHWLIAVALYLAAMPLVFALPTPVLPYSEVSPAFAPWNCQMENNVEYNACLNGPRFGVLFSTTERCSFDPSTNNYLVGNPTMSFSLDAKRSGTLYFSLYECSNGPASITLKINDLCTVEIPNSAYGMENPGRMPLHMPLETSCLKDGENTLKFEGSFSMARGVGSCPLLSCMNAPLYLYPYFPQATIAKQANGSLAIGEETSAHSFEFNIPAGTVASASLPADASGATCSPNCNVSGNAVSIGPGSNSLSYRVENLAVGVSFASSAYSKDEQIIGSVSVAKDGAPASANVYFSDGILACAAPAGSCEIEFSDKASGSHSVQLQAESSDARVGIAQASYVVEGEPEVTMGEALEGKEITVTYGMANPTHSQFSRATTYELPADFSGSLNVNLQNMSISGRTLSFLLVCEAYSNCQYEFTYPVLGIASSAGEPGYPSIARVGEMLSGEVLVTLRSENTVRPIRSTGTVEGICTGACYWDETLAPLQVKTLKFGVSKQGALECGITSQGRGKVAACVEVPQNFPSNVALEYLVLDSTLPGYLNGGQAHLGVRELSVARQGTGLLLQLGILRPGRHSILIAYETASEQLQELPGGQSTPEMQKKTSLTAPDKVIVGETALVFVFVDGEPAKGFAKIVSPAGGELAIELANGKGSFAPDERGMWTVSFGSEEKNILVEESTTETIQKITAADNSLGGKGSYVGETGSKAITASFPIWPWALVVLVPLLGVIAGGYYLFSMNKEQVIVEKEFAAGVVAIFVENKGADLSDVSISDPLPDGAHVGERGLGSIKKTVLGDVIKWRVPSLKNGEKWEVKYSISTKARILDATKIAGTDAKGKHRSFVGNIIEI